MPDIDLKEEFPLPDDLVFLNHAGCSPWPRRTAVAVQRFAQENLTEGPVRYEEWLKTEAALREQLATLINAPTSDDIALVKNTSEALSFVAHGVRWRPGDNVVIPDQEFPSNRVVWESLAPQGVDVRQVSLSRGESPEAALCGAVDERTRLVSVSAVQYGDGLRLDLAALGGFCRDRGVLFCVDAIQSLGALMMDVQDIQADFVMADGHKWLLAPEGLGVFYCRTEVRDQLQLHQFGWRMVEHCGDFDRRDWQPARSARRFECGTPNMTGIHGLHASLSLLTEVGLHRIQTTVLDNARYLMERLDRRADIELLTPADEARHAGIVTFRCPDRDAALLLGKLREHRVICAARSGGIRFSPHFYVPRAQLDRAVQVLESILAEG